MGAKQKQKQQQQQQQHLRRNMTKVISTPAAVVVAVAWLLARMSIAFANRISISVFMSCAALAIQI